MAEEQKNTIYNVRVTAEDALKTLAELKLRSQELRDQQKALGKVTEENAQEYYALDNQIKAINSEANKYQKQIQNNIKLQNQQEASLAKLRTQLALDNAEFAELGNSMQDAARKAELGKRIAETTEELKAQEEALGDYRRSVGNYEKATDNLKQELNDLTDTLIRMAQAGDTSSASFMRWSSELVSSSRQRTLSIQPSTRPDEGLTHWSLLRMQPQQSLPSTDYGPQPLRYWGARTRNSMLP